VIPLAPPLTRNTESVLMWVLIGIGFDGVFFGGGNRQDAENAKE
jgi:hypothetical protein